MSYTKYWIALGEGKGMGPAHLLEVYEKLKSMGLSIEDLFGLNEDEIKSEFHFHHNIVKGIINSKNMLHAIETDYLNLLDSGIDVIPFFSEDYPLKFKKELGHSFPPFLYTLGNRALLNKKGIAILGDKNISGMGEMITASGARTLARHDIVTISGFAGGADMAAHRSALEHGGETIAFIPSGMSHLKMPGFFQEILDYNRTLFVSTFYPGLEATKFNAYIRNKFVCALSYAVYIVEAPTEGGIFEAAKSAQKLGVPLFTTEYGEYPESASGNRKILDEMEGIPVKGRMENENLVPNLDNMIGILKYG